MAKKNGKELNNINDLAMWINNGQEVGFTFGEKSYCVSYGTYPDGQPYITIAEIGGEPLGHYIDLDEFLTYARVQGNLIVNAWPIATDIKLFIPKEEANV